MNWLSREFHSHTFDVVDVAHRNAGAAFDPHTDVLERCRCGTCRVLTLRGRWTRAQVLGRPEPVLDEEGAS